MKKSKLKKLEKIARNMGDYFHIHYENVKISGSDLNLCVVGSSPYDDRINYNFKSPIFTKRNNLKFIKRLSK